MYSYTHFHEQADFVLSVFFRAYKRELERVASQKVSWPLAKNTLSWSRSSMQLECKDLAVGECRSAEWTVVDNDMCPRATHDL